MKMILILFASALFVITSCGGSTDRQMETTQDTSSSSAMPDTPNTLTNPQDSVMVNGDTGRQPIANDPNR